MALLREENSRRPFHFGPYPFETLARNPEIEAQEAGSAALPQSALDDTGNELARIARIYANRFLSLRNGDVEHGRAAVPEDLARRSMDVKGLCLFLDAAHVGICKVPASAWYANRERADQQYGVVIVVEDGRMPEQGEMAYRWLDGAAKDISRMRGTEIAVSLAAYVRTLGFSATVQTAHETDVDLDKLAVLSGVAARRGEDIVSPYLGDGITVAAVTTEYPLAVDQPLASNKPANRGFRYWRGINGALSGRERNRRARRPLHMSRYPMEQVKRVDRPTTLIIDDEVPRVPKRADGFARATMGDFGKKAKAAGFNGMMKSPHNTGIMAPLPLMVPYQDGEVADSISADCGDPAKNARAIRSLAYHMGADLVGICEVPDYAWYSHKSDGEPIEPYHRYAICMLIDQGYETMEGASGDDWISAAQSMRAYTRGGEIAGVMGEFIRGLGFPARAQTAADGDVQQIPLLLWAGLGELSRIGELVLNPYVGPRFKSVVLTTDLPLEIDKPIDFGLQYFCSNCLKCSRECPVNAMSFGDKVMFNGYEMWKPDIERCVSYRLTNHKGSMCGRCMKMCPLNKIPSVDGPLVHRIGTWLGVNARWLKPVLVPIAVYFDDKLGYGKRNPNKKWWVDMELVDGAGQPPAKGSNERDLDLGDLTKRASKQKIAYYPANVMPPPDADDAFPADRKAAIAIVKDMETPAQARARVAAGGATPAMYFAPRQQSSDRETAIPHAAPAVASGPPAGLGRWQLSLKTPMGERTPLIEIVESGSGCAGTVTDETGTRELFDVNAHGNELEFSAEVKSPMGKMKLRFMASISGDSLTGKVKTPMGKNPFGGERLPAAEMETAEAAG